MGITLTIPDLPMTPEEFDDLPDVEGVRFELVEGKPAGHERGVRAWHGKMIYEMFRLELTDGAPWYVLRQRQSVSALLASRQPASAAASRSTRRKPSMSGQHAGPGPGRRFVTLQ